MQCKWATFQLYSGLQTINHVDKKLTMGVWTDVLDSA
jgi:hypothetical protein